MLLEQKGLCAACGKPPEPPVEGSHGNAGNPLVIDHDHATNVIRGLIHTRCNKLLGHAQDDVSVLMGAIAYLQKSKGAHA